MPTFSRRDLFRVAAAGTATVAVQHLTGPGSWAATSDPGNTLPRIGWSCPIPNLSDRLGQFPNARYVRVFRRPGQGLPGWSQLNAIPGDVVVHLSIKDRGQPVGEWLAARPARWTAPLVFTLDHEPEQQDGGDPTPAEFLAEWDELTRSLTGHPRRGSIILTPTYTRYAAEFGANRDTWYRDFGRVVELPGVDAVAFDVYNPGRTYQTPAQMFDWVIGFAREHQLPLYIAEWGRERLGTDDGTVCAQLMRDDVDYLRAAGAAGAAWFYNGGDNLDTGDGGKPRVPERQALADLIAAQ